MGEQSLAGLKEILEAATKPEFKKKLNDNTQIALDHGAFGAPWFWVKNRKGEEEPFFGSDRSVVFVCGQDGC